MIQPGDERVQGFYCDEGHPIYYNGNYFCSEWDSGCYIMDPDEPNEPLIAQLKKQRKSK